MKTIKKFNAKDLFGLEYNKLAEDEIKTMKSIDHDHIVQYFDDFTLDIFDSCFFSIVVEFCEVYEKQINNKMSIFIEYFLF